MADQVLQARSNGTTSDLGVTNDQGNINLAVRDEDTNITLASVLAVLNSVLTELGQKLEPGQEVALPAATVADLKNVTASLSGDLSLDAATLAALEDVTATISNLPAEYPLPASQVQTDALTNAELRAAPVAVDTGLAQPLQDGGTVVASQAATFAVADDYAAGEILADQTGPGVLTFTFTAPVQTVWVAAVDPTDLTAAGEVRVDPFGGIPSDSLGIPVALGGAFPIPAVTGAVKVYAPAGIRVTVYGNRR